MRSSKSANLIKPAVSSDAVHQLLVRRPITFGSEATDITGLLFDTEIYTPNSSTEAMRRLRCSILLMAMVISPANVVELQPSRKYVMIKS